MRRSALQLFTQLQEEPQTISELAAALDLSEGWVSELVADLAEQHLVEKNTRVHLADAYEARLLTNLAEEYTLSAILAGVKEDLLAALYNDPKTVGELEQEGFATSTVYAALEDLQAVGVVTKTGETYTIGDDTLQRFIAARHSQDSNTIKTRDGVVKRLPPGTEPGEGVETAFSVFQRYGVDYFPSNTYIYIGEQRVDKAAALIHAVAFAQDKKQAALCTIFYCKHQDTLDTDRLWRLAHQWQCTERWADVLAFLDQRDVKDADLFLPWEEFRTLAKEYGVHPRDQYPGNVLQQVFRTVGDSLAEEVDVYLLGGGNLILRGLKDTTKDIDIVLDNKDAYQRLVAALEEQGYAEPEHLPTAYQDLGSRIILDHDQTPRWDIFVDTVAKKLQLTDAMKQRSDEKLGYGNLSIHLLSLTDMFLFKSVTDREGDLEDCALIARRNGVDWEQVLEEIKTQEERTDKYFSFAVLDTLDLLVDRYSMTVPVRQRLASYCLEQALLLTLEEPKTIDDLRAEINFPDHQIYNKLRKLEAAERITVDRSGILNRYVKKEE